MPSRTTLYRSTSTPWRSSSSTSTSRVRAGSSGASAPLLVVRVVVDVQRPGSAAARSDDEVDELLEGQALLGAVVRPEGRNSMSPPFRSRRRTGTRARRPRAGRLPCRRTVALVGRRQAMEAATPLGVERQHDARLRCPCAAPRPAVRACERSFSSVSGWIRATALPQGTAASAPSCRCRVAAACIHGVRLMPATWHRWSSAMRCAVAALAPVAQRAVLDRARDRRPPRPLATRMPRGSARAAAEVVQVARPTRKARSLSVAEHDVHLLAARRPGRRAKQVAVEGELHEELGLRRARQLRVGDLVAPRAEGRTARHRRGAGSRHARRAPVAQRRLVDDLARRFASRRAVRATLSSRLPPSAATSTIDSPSRAQPLQMRALVRIALASRTARPTRRARLGRARRVVAGAARSSAARCSHSRKLARSVAE